MEDKLEAMRGRIMEYRTLASAVEICIELVTEGLMDIQHKSTVQIKEP